MIEILVSEIKTYQKKRVNHSDYRFGGWYMITNTKNGLSYIGKSIELIFRLRQHITLKNPKILIDKEIQKYGIESFRFYIIDTYENHGIDFFNRKIEIKVENDFILKHNTNYPKGYNMRHYEWL